MKKFLIRFFFLLLTSLVLLVIYLNYFGIKTNKFDQIIKSKANTINQYVKIDFEKTKIYLNLIEFNLVVKLQNPEVLLKNNKIDLSKLDLFLSLKSFYTSDFLLKRAEIAFAKNDIKDLTKITNIFLPRFINKRLKKIFVKGILEGELIFSFNKQGSIANDYKFVGKIFNANINLTNGFLITDLTTEISYGKNSKTNGFVAIIKKGFLLDLKLDGSIINIINKKNGIKIKNLIHTSGKLNSSQIKKITNLFRSNIKILEDINTNIDLKTNINFNLDKKLKIRDLTYLTEGNVSYFEASTNENKILTEYLPDYKAKLILKDVKVKFYKSSLDQSIELKGLFKTNDAFDNFDINQKYDRNKKEYDVNGVIDFTNSIINLTQLNFIKKKGKKAELFFNINYILDKSFHIKNLKFTNNETKILLSNIKLNNKFQIDDFKYMEVKTFSNNIINNDFFIKKNKKIIISGKVVDFKPLLKNIFNKNDKKNFSKKFKSEINVNFEKTLTGTNDDVSNLSIVASITKGSYDKLSLKGNFSEDEIIEISLYKINDDKKTLQVISDRARPFIKHFDFIKGFEGGKLVYETVILKEKSNSSLIINDFKVSKVPALAKLLTLASLQGIADTLSGEGIRFESFEMKLNSIGNVLNIEEAIAMGPAVSILLDGYVDKGKVVSLSGTLVPATKLNAFIAKIPLVGNILVGKKTGEGVVGVSFKMKGPPKNIKTTVNPIKTLTPRFILRAIENMKKKKTK